MGNFKEDIVKTEAFVFDVDGVFTDGGITPFGDDFIRRYYAKDGYAVSYASKLGYKICIITGGRGKWLQERFERLRVTKIYADCADKIAALREFLDEYGLDARNVVFMGDDIPDLECMRAVGIPVAPADAASEILEAARYVSEYPGGRGCVRDIVEQVLRARGQWAPRASTARRRPNRSDRRPVRRKSVIRVRQTVIRLPVRPCGTRIFASEEIPFGPVRVRCPCGRREIRYMNERMTPCDDLCVLRYWPERCFPAPATVGAAAGAMRPIRFSIPISR